MRNIVFFTIMLLSLFYVPSYASPGFMDGQAYLMTFVAGMVCVGWLIVLLALFFFRYYRKSASPKLRLARSFSVITPAILAGLAIIVGFKLSGHEIARLFYNSIIFFAAVGIGFPGLLFGAIHWTTSSIQKNRPQRDTWIYNAVILFWVAIPLALGWQGFKLFLQTTELRAQVRPVIGQCCGGKSDSCLQASNLFGDLSKLHRYNSQFGDMKRKYMAQACQTGDQDSCKQFFYDTGEKRYQEHWLYKQPCDEADADIPMFKPETDCC